MPTLVSKDGETYTTESPREVVRLKAAGYREADADAKPKRRRSSSSDTE